MSADLLVEQDDSILRVVLNRPADGNAVSDEMAAELTDILQKADSKIRVIVLRGAGPDFCVGRASMTQRAPAGRDALQRRDATDVFFNCYDAFRRARVPIIGVVQGKALGFGCAVAALCDITIASDAATFQMPELKHNIMPTILLSALVDRVSRKTLAYLTYSAVTFSATRARDYGLVSEIVAPADLVRTAQDLAGAIVSAPRPATEGIKEYLRAAPDMATHGAVEYARNLHATINSSAEMKRT